MGNTDDPERLPGRRLLKTHAPGMCYISEQEVDWVVSKTASGSRVAGCCSTVVTVLSPGHGHGFGVPKPRWSRVCVRDS